MMIGIRADESYNRFVAIASLINNVLPMISPGLLPHQAVIVVHLPHLRLESR